MILFDLPMTEYRAHSALGSTDLKNILKSPRHFRHARENPTTSDALKFGSAVHTYLLEREQFFRIYTVEPEGLVNKAKNPWKAEWDAFKAAHEGFEILSRKEWEAIKGIRDNIYEHPYAKKIMDQSKREVSVLCDKLKGRADLLSDVFISDIKTCEDADADELRWSVQRFQYYLQAALYTDLFEQADGKHRQFIWIACEKAPPYGVKVYVASDEMIEMGRREYKAALEIYERCVEKNEWPGYDIAIEELAFLPWFKGVIR